MEDWYLQKKLILLNKYHIFNEFLTIFYVGTLVYQLDLNFFDTFKLVIDAETH